MIVLHFFKVLQEKKRKRKSLEGFKKKTRYGFSILIVRKVLTHFSFCA